MDDTMISNMILAYDHSDLTMAQPLFENSFSREMDISDESPFVAWKTLLSRPKSTSVDPLPAAAGHDADTTEDTYDCVERSSPVSVAESPVVEKEVQSSPQLIRPDQHNDVSEPCLRKDGKEPAQPRKRGRPRKITGDSNISQEPQIRASSSNVYETSRQDPGNQMVRSSRPIPSLRGRGSWTGRGRGQKFSNRSIQRKVRTNVRPGDTITRSGRKSIPPVSVWRGDKIVVGKEVFSDPARQDHFILPTVKEVVRNSDNTAAATKHEARKSRKQRNKDSTLKPRITPQEWEMGVGRQSVACRIQESEEEDDASVGGASSYVNLDVAFSSGSILGLNCPKREVHWGQIKVPNFSPFGFINLPAGTEKARSHAKTTNNIFLVHNGQVTVTINAESFTATAGSSFVVPKGILSSLHL
ncbi:centromere associated protein [Fusarium globosum]|uniref:Centromere associated protein n=1 Tax=Fusarium globosum TaxID=78864 RepID=A0A8H5YPT8_9HYPO|nr:centromere associated protein [Fusarium globosum]